MVIPHHFSSTSHFFSSFTFQKVYLLFHCRVPDISIPTPNLPSLRCGIFARFEEAIYCMLMDWTGSKDSLSKKRTHPKGKSEVNTHRAGRQSRALVFCFCSLSLSLSLLLFLSFTQAQEKVFVISIMLWALLGWNFFFRC